MEEQGTLQITEFALVQISAPIVSAETPAWPMVSEGYAGRPPSCQGLRDLMGRARPHGPDAFGERSEEGCRRPERACPGRPSHVSPCPDRTRVSCRLCNFLLGCFALLVGRQGDDGGLADGGPIPAKLHRSPLRRVNTAKARVTHRLITGVTTLAASGLLFLALVSQVGAFTYHWELDEAPQGSDRVSQVRPVQVLLSDQLLEIAPHSASLQLMKKYSVHLGEEWSSGHAYSLLRTFESIPQEVNSPYDEEPQVPPSVWRLTHEHIQDAISVDLQDGQRIVTIAQEAFVHSEPLLAEIEGVRGRFFSKRLHEAVVRFVTEGGANRVALKRILQERYGVSVDVPDYTALTRGTTEETASRFSEFKNEELLFLASMLEEYPEGMRLTPGLRYLVRRLDGTPHPMYAEAPAVAWPTAGYIEFMESAFKGQGPAYIHRLILHEKAHFLWEHLFDDQLKQDWIDLGDGTRTPMTRTAGRRQSSSSSCQPMPTAGIPTRTWRRASATTS